MIKLPSGKEFYANKGLVSINLTKTDYFFIGEGYDGDVSMTRYDEIVEDYVSTWTQDELVELAEMMINRWQEFRFAILNNTITAKEIRMP